VVDGSGLEIRNQYFGLNWTQVSNISPISVQPVLYGGGKWTDATRTGPNFYLKITYSGYVQRNLPGQITAQNPPSNKLFAVGAFTTALEHVAFAAQTKPKGGFAGYVVQEFLTTGETDSGPVTCLQPVPTASREAFVTFFVKNGPDAGMYRSFLVADLGEPVMGVPPDGYADCGTQTSNCPSSATCSNQPLIRGNIVVSSGQ
jgi:hypothetical protein